MRMSDNDLLMDSDLIDWIQSISDCNIPLCFLFYFFNHFFNI